MMLASTTTKMTYLLNSKYAIKEQLHEAWFIFISQQTQLLTYTKLTNLY